MKKTICHKSKGFSLIEILVVLAIMAILITLAVPSNKGRYDKVKVKESLVLIDTYKAQIEAIYALTGEFPEDNAAAGLPEPQQIVGNFLSSTELEQGAFHLELGNKISPDLQGLMISVRPVFVPGVENAPVSWICGDDTVPENMVAAGENKTNIPVSALPIVCR
ncbi:prepilin-type N-terminal cleavage/methylation domain-containing protein [Agaribacterium sp. ZY112]|uniref:prepilin-type N-terminal cleavage/methylation domain-containing protein n=1 Tax=Agaribacterium sp. ZY112 TaxID=3233574 RepID=UPI003523DFBB